MLLESDVSDTALEDGLSAIGNVLLNSSLEDCIISGLCVLKFLVP